MSDKIKPSFMKKIITTVLALAFVYSASAQQDPQFSQNMHNKLYPNPAYAGNSDAFCIGLLYRAQWTGFDGAPKTGVLSLDGPIRSINSGIGLTVMTDKLGFEKTLQAKLAYAYRFNVGATGKLAIGVDLGFIQKELSGDFIANDPNDPIIPYGGEKGSTIPDLGAGLYYNNDNLYVGLSASHILEPEIDLSTVNYQYARHYYGMIGYKIDLTPSLALTPSIYAKYDGVTVQSDFNATLHINDKIWVGASYRLEDAVVLMAGFKILQNLKVGYSYDYNTSDINKYSNGSHEVFLGYCFNPPKKVNYRIKNVRYL